MSGNRWIPIVVSTVSGRAAAASHPPVRALMMIAVLAVAGLLASPVSAAAPERFGPATYDYTFIGFECDGFEIQIAGTGSDRLTAFFDASGDVVKLTYYGRFPHDVMTNTVTGRSIVVRGDFQEMIVRTPGTDEFIKSVVGHRYMVNEPGVGVTIRDVGRITYGDLEQTMVRWQAGEHDLALDASLQPTFCTALR
jgi:hypothetical protein